MPMLQQMGMAYLSGKLRVTCHQDFIFVELWVGAGATESGIVLVLAQSATSCGPVNLALCAIIFG